MKKFLSLFLILLMITTLISCSSDATDSTADDASEITLPADDELGGVVWENGYLYIDEKDPIIPIGDLKKEVTLSDGTKGTSTLVLPYLNVDLEGAKNLSMQIYDIFNGKYGEYFKSPDDRIINIDYTYEIAQDTLCILIKEKIQSTAAVSEKTYGYYYDILVDDPISLVGFPSLCATSFGAILEALHETDWATAYSEEKDVLPDENTITALTYNSEDGTFDVYCTNTDNLTQTILEITPVEEEMDFSQLESYITD